MSDRAGRVPSFERTRAAEMAASLAVVLIGVAAYVVLSASFDARMASYAEELPPDAVAWGAMISEIGLSGYMFAVSAALTVAALAARALLPTRRFDAALTALAERATYVFAVLCLSGLAAQLIKHLVGRARPSSFRSFGPYHFDLFSMKNSLASFPSGHSTTAFAMAVALSLLMPRLRVALFTLATAICLSRMIVQAHYASDIVAGALLGTGSALLVAHAFARRALAFEGAVPHLVLKDDGVVRAAALPLAWDRRL